MTHETAVTKRTARALLTFSFVAGAAVVGVAGAGGSAHADVVHDGTAPERAAASCWEVKQTAPASPSGSYWLLTPALRAPQQFYCDQQTDGGGWVLIGKGREGWQEFYGGQGNATTLLDPPTPREPSYFNTVQLPAPTVDELLNNTKVKDLTDGIRLVRARSSDGAQWQEVRMRLSSRDRFVWAFGANHPVQSYGFDGANSSGGATSNFGSDSAWKRVTFSYASGQNWTAGFAYGTGASGGTTASNNFLYSAAGNGSSARPYTEMYVRPRLTQADLNWAAISDTGTSKIEQRAMASSYAARGDWGVTGHFNRLTAEGNTEVQDFVQIGNRVFVAGNFEYVQRGSNDPSRVRQPALAAFDADTGAYISSFTPTFDNQVKGLAKLPNGKLVAVGDFSTVNGSAATGTVVLDPTTGQRDTNWNVDIENRLTSGVRTVRTVDVAGDWVYIAGGFTHVGASPTTNKVYTKHAARINWTTGMPDGSWNPNLNGTVMANDVSDAGDRMYAAGFFTQSNGVAAKNAAAIQTVPGAALAQPTWAPVWSGAKSYQQAIQEVGDKVYVGGSEHNLFSFDTSSFARTSGTTMQGTGGDIQAISSGEGVVYAGCHCGSWAYENNFTWPGIGNTWTQADKIQWLGAWDAATGQFLPAFNPPLLGSNNAGVWALYVADNGTIWAGGDLTGARYNSDRSQWVGSFARFPLVDHVAPTSPTNLRMTQQAGTTVALAWDASTDDSGSVTYEILRDDRVIATTTSRTATVETGAASRFFVRAGDSAGNRSASTPVFDIGVPTTTTTTIPPTTTTIPPTTTTIPPTTTTIPPTTTTIPPTTTTIPPTTTTPGQPESAIAFGSSWRYRYDQAAPDASWANVGFDDSLWETGFAPIGWGSNSIVTNINRPSVERAVTLYERSGIDLSDASTVKSLQLTVIVDDGAVIRVNGNEIARERMSPGTISHGTYANAAIATSNARANPTVIDVPLAVLVDGQNVIGVETHLNYRATSSVSFDLQAVVTR